MKGFPWNYVLPIFMDLALQFDPDLTDIQFSPDPAFDLFNRTSPCRPCILTLLLKLNFRFCLNCQLHLPAPPSVFTPCSRSLSCPFLLSTTRLVLRTSTYPVVLYAHQAHLSSFSAMTSALRDPSAPPCRRRLPLPSRLLILQLIWLLQIELLDRIGCL